MHPFRHRHHFKPPAICGGIPMGFGYEIDEDGMTRPFLLERCRCGETRRAHTSGVYLPHATIETGKPVRFH